MPLAVLCLYLGFQPKPLTDAMQASVEQTLAQYPERVIERQQVMAATFDGPVIRLVDATGQMPSNEERGLDD